MTIETSPQGEFERYQWRAHAVNEVMLSNDVFHVRTRPERSASEMRKALESWVEDPDGPPQMPRREALDYEPLTRRNLPSAMARIATASDRESERNSARRGELRQRYLGAGKQREEAEWLANLNVSQAAERATIKEITYFYHHYGELGFQQLRDEASWPDAGEPLGWIIAEARTVRFALALIDALNRKDLPDLHAALASRRLPDLPGLGEQRERVFSDKLVRYAVCRNARHHGRSWDPSKDAWPEPDVSWYDPTARFRLRGEDEVALTDHAGAIVADLVRHHLPGQEYGFFWRDGRFVEAPSGGPLLRAVWLHVKNTAIDRAEVRSCLECGTPFLVTDRRQRFCPPQEPGGKSRCLARRQMRLLRKEGPKRQSEEER